MAAPPRLHQELGANWVEVTKAVSGEATGHVKARSESDFENAASNNPLKARSHPSAGWSSRT